MSSLSMPAHEATRHLMVYPSCFRQSWFPCKTRNDPPALVQFGSSQRLTTSCGGDLVLSTKQALVPRARVLPAWTALQAPVSFPSKPSHPRLSCPTKASIWSCGHRRLISFNHKRHGASIHRLSLVLSVRVLPSYASFCTNNQLLAFSAMNDEASRLRTSSHNIHNDASAGRRSRWASSFGGGA